ncbi:MAG: Hsp20/alpha crystallin family protein [Thaumarchaeota archaeon]|nr:Hsp20/alpha crystallin family protein [Nitrososphaerota archaeon]
MGLVRYMAKEVLKEIGNRSREFYEFVLPPVDMYLDGDDLIVTIDMAGFDKKYIKLRIKGNILSINAKREDEYDGTMIWRQRPQVIDKKIRLPADIKEGEEEINSAKFSQGVITLKIPIKHTGKDINIE